MVDHNGTLTNGGDADKSAAGEATGKSDKVSGSAKSGKGSGSVVGLPTANARKTQDASKNADDREKAEATKGAAVDRSAVPRAKAEKPAEAKAKVEKPAEAKVAKPADANAEPVVIEVRPMAAKAEMRLRHWGLVLSFLLMVLIPVTAVGYYMYKVASDQYASTSGFTIRNEDLTSPAELMGGLSKFMGTSSAGEADMLYEFIQSQDLVTKLDQRLNLTAHYSANYRQDPVFRLKPGGTIEDLVEYWRRIVKVSYDQSTGLINLHVRAFDPDMAQRLAEEIIAESQVLVNELNATARNDLLKYAEQDLADAITRLKQSREAMVRFRSRTQIVDPESDLQGRMGVIASLQQQLAQALIEYDLVSQESGSSDPRVTTAARRIDVIRERISEERRTFSADDEVGGTEGYPTLLAEYESLMVDREYSEGAYAAALAALDLARANAARQSRYLATYLKPSFPEKAEYPQRGLILGLTSLFLLLFWSIATLMFYALRDRK